MKKTNILFGKAMIERITIESRKQTLIMKMKMKRESKEQS
jgi:hypothetical protein